MKAKKTKQNEHTHHTLDSYFCIKQVAAAGIFCCFGSYFCLDFSANLRHKTFHRKCLEDFVVFEPQNSYTSNYYYFWMLQFVIVAAAAAVGWEKKPKLTDSVCRMF